MVSHLPTRTWSSNPKRVPANPNHQLRVIYLDGRNPAPLKKTRNEDSPVNTNVQWFPMISKWCRISSIHSINKGFHKNMGK